MSDFVFHFCISRFHFRKVRYCLATGINIQIFHFSFGIRFLGFEISYNNFGVPWLRPFEKLS